MLLSSDYSLVFSSELISFYQIFRLPEVYFNDSRQENINAR